MVVRIRLARHGIKIRNRPFYNIVVANAKSPRDGKHIEKVGLYDPIPNEHGIKNVELNSDRIKYWLSVGAWPSDTVARLLSKVINKIILYFFWIIICFIYFIIFA
jgi:small subunit ribosomal protein S16